jgi:hypothetical protein
MLYFRANVEGGLTWCHFLDIPTIFFVISHILFNMLEINVYSIIDSKVFGVTIGVNFLFSIVIKRFNDCKHMVEEEMMQLKSIGGKNAN